MIIKLKNVSKKYKDSNFSLNNISFTINNNEILGIIGKNGTGKSTILKMICAVTNYDDGEIYYKDELISSLKEDALRKMRKNVAYIFQNSNLLENKSVYYHLSLIYKLNNKKVNEKEIDDILSFMEITRLKKSLCGSLSGGEQQRVAIAMAILQKPEVLLCDEISSALDYTSEKEIFNLLTKIKREKKISIVMISHNLSLVKNFCDKVLVLENSTITNTIIPVKSKTNDYDENYYNYVKEFLENV